MKEYFDVTGNSITEVNRWEGLKRAYMAALPRECCGFLLGDRNGTKIRILQIVSTLNAIGVNDSFAIPDHEIDRVKLLAAELKLDIVAMYHSHPYSSGILSDSDKIALNYSEWPWVIVTRNENTSEIFLTWYDVTNV